MPAARTVRAAGIHGATGILRGADRDGPAEAATASRWAARPEAAADDADITADLARAAVEGAAWRVAADRRAEVLAAGRVGRTARCHAGPVVATDRAFGTADTVHGVAAIGAARAAQPFAVKRAVVLPGRTAELRCGDTADRDETADAGAAAIPAQLGPGRAAAGAPAKRAGRADVAALTAVVRVEEGVDALVAALRDAVAVIPVAIVPGRAGVAAGTAVVVFPKHVGAGPVAAELVDVATDTVAADRVVGRTGRFGRVGYADPVRLIPSQPADLALAAGRSARTIGLHLLAGVDADGGIA